MLTISGNTILRDGVVIDRAGKGQIKQVLAYHQEQEAREAHMNQLRGLYTVHDALGTQVGTHSNRDACCRWVRSLGAGYFSDGSDNYDMEGNVCTSPDV